MDYIDTLYLADITKFKELDNGIYLTAFGGIPITSNEEGEKYNFFHGASLITNRYYFINLVTSGLGASGILTYDNKSNMNLMDLGRKCSTLQHTWAYNWMTVTLLFKGQHKDVEMGFLRDSRFFQSWNLTDPNVYAFSGTLKSFKKYCKNKDDKSFDKNLREALSDIDNKFGYIWL